MSGRDHNKGYDWDHNRPDNQDGFINSLIKKGKSVVDIIDTFEEAYPKHANPRKRVLRHINHLVKGHDDFPYKLKDGRFIKKD